MNQQHGTTPRLDALLDRLGRTLKRSAWLHGLGTATAVAAIWLCFMYASDRFLALPTAIRIAHLVVLVGGFGFLANRFWLRHRRSIPDRAGLALMAERARPEADQGDDLFISALQLGASVPADAPSASLVKSLRARADEAAGRVDLGKITDARGPVRRMAGAVLGVGIAAVALGAQPAMARIFLDRMVGGDAQWPRATTLVVEVPSDAPGLDISRPDEETLLVRVARGSDVPLLVQAEGKVPDTVQVAFGSGSTIDITGSGAGLFRTVLPAVQEDTTLVVTGGDDQRGLPVVRLEVLQPPDISGLAFVVTPPAYTGLPATIETDTKISVLEGSDVAVHIQVDPTSATGIARTFPDGRPIELSDGTFPELPPRPDAAADSAAAPPAGSLTFTERATDSLRFRFELQDESGLQNPDPALFGIEVVQDRRPELVTLAPGRAEVDVVEGGALPLRLLVRDDFGIRAAAWESLAVGTESRLNGRDFALADVIDPDASSDARARSTQLGSELLEVSDLGGDEQPIATGSQVLLRTFATDSREPEPGRAVSGAILVRVVSGEEFLRTQRDALGRAADDVGRVDRRLEDTDQTLTNLGIVVSGDDAEVPAAGELVALTSEVRRVQGDLTSVARDLADVTTAMVFSRLDDRAGAVERRLQELTGDSVERSFDPEVWSAIASELTGGRLGSPERVGDLVGLVGLALEVSGPKADAVIDALETLRSATGVEDSRVALASTNARMSELRATMEQLVGELGEWDSLQSILFLARDILNRQKSLKERTRAVAGEDR